MRHLLLSLVLLSLFACAPRTETVRPGRGVAAYETGPMAWVKPRGEPARLERHGRWRGYDDQGKIRFEVRYTRGQPSGAYREWTSSGRLVAEWTYNWKGNLDGWARWYDESGNPLYKRRLKPDQVPPDGSIGYAAHLREWASLLPEPPTQSPESKEKSP